ncbi:MAG: nucleotidyltransferase family protein [Oceanicaulis sp.]
MSPLSESDREAALIDAVRADPVAEAILLRAPELGLSDWALCAGAVYQNVWNALTGRPAGYGIKDYDLAYFDAGDLSWEAEDAVIRRCADVFADLPAPVEIRNQARVHLWFPERFGRTIEPFTSTEDGIAHYAASAHMAGLRREADGSHTVLAPRGLSDVFAMRLAPRAPETDTADYRAKSERMKLTWPEIELSWV